MGDQAKAAGKTLFGGGQDAGAMGLGQFKGDKANIDEKAFTSTRKTDKRQKDFLNQLKETEGRQVDPVTGATIDQSQQWEWKEGQRNLRGQLEAQAAGQGPSLAQSQLQQATNRNLAQSMALAGSQRGSNPGMGLRQVANNQALMNQQAARASADLRMQEQMSARAQLGDVLSQARGQDIGLATSQAGLSQQANLANQQAALQQTALNDAQNRFYNTGLMNMDQQELDAKRELQRMRLQENTALQGLNQSGYESASNRRGNFVSGLAEGAATAAAMSDKRTKKNITEMEYSDEELKKDKIDLDANMSKKSDNSDELKRLISGTGPQMSTNEAPAPKTEIAPTGGSDMDPMKMLSSLGGSKEKSTLTQSPTGGVVSSGESHKGMGKAAGAGLAMLAMSDKNDKKDVEPSKNKLRDFLGALKAYEYEYKDPKHGEGKYVSPMAQDLEKSDLGKGLIKETPDGKMVDYGRAGGLMLATSAMLNTRMEDIEKKLGEVFSKRKG